MRLQIHSIAPELQPYVKLICSMECNNDADTRHIRVLPDTCVELFVNYTDTPVAVIGNELHQHSIITFRMSRPMDVQMRKGSGCLAICFYPGMAYKFFRFPMHTLADTTTALADVWEITAAEIEDRLANAGNNEIRAAIIQHHLLQLLADAVDDKQVDYCISQSQLSAGSVSVKQLSNEAGISQRHLARKFQQYIGLSPKEYLRVNRFIKSLQYLKEHQQLSLTEIAHESGYYDQAHFIHDYKTYTGYTPGEVARSQHILY